MKGSLVLKSLENGKRVTNTIWPEGHYWEMEQGKIISVGGGRILSPDYEINDLYNYGGWQVIPKYISFGDAMKAVEAGKDVECHFKDEVITVRSYNGKPCAICYGTHCTSGGGASLNMAYMVAGKWLVKENTDEES